MLFSLGCGYTNMLMATHIEQLTPSANLVAVGEYNVIKIQPICKHVSICWLSMLFALCAAERECLYGGGDCPDHEEAQKAKELMLIHMSSE